MGVEFSITEKGSDKEIAYVILSGSNGWRDDWLPAAEDLQLALIPFLADGALTNCSGELVPEVVRQLELVLEWMEANRPETRHLAAITRTIDALRMAQSEGISKYEISFG